MKELIGLAVEDVLIRCGVGYEQIRLIDDPPGRLRAIELACPALKSPGSLTLDVGGDKPLFSMEQSWPPSEVLRLKVRNVVDSSDELF